MALTQVQPTMLTQPLTQGTAVASTSGTSIDFTGIPSWAKRITVMFNGVSGSGTSPFLIQIGAGSVTTSGYYSATTTMGASLASTSSTAGFILMQAVAASELVYGGITLFLQTGNSWVESGVLGRNTAGTHTSGGSIALGGTLDRVRITTVNGTDTFDAGSINILYE